MTLKFDLTAGTTIATGTVQPPKSHEEVWADIKKAQAMIHQLKAEDPMVQFFKDQGVDVNTHDVVLHDSHRALFAASGSPIPHYLKFSPHARIDSVLGIERMGLFDSKRWFEESEQARSYWWDSPIVENKHD